LKSKDDTINTEMWRSQWRQNYAQTQWRHKGNLTLRIPHKKIKFAILRLSLGLFLRETMFQQFSFCKSLARLLKVLKASLFW